MDNDFNTILSFLDESAEVGGRSLEPLPDPVAEQLERFIRGDLEDDERAALLETLQAHPDWIAALADRIREHEA